MQARQQVMQAREAVHQHSMALQTARTRLDALEQAVARLARQMATQQARLQEVAQLIADCKAPDSDEEAELELMLGQKLHAEKRLKEAREALESVEQRLRSLEQQWRQADIRLQTVRTDLERHRLELAELNTRKEGAGAQLEEHEQALEPLLADLPEQAQLEDWELNLKRVRERIQRLGNINLAAIEEYEQQSLRKNFLDIQDADLNKALDTLENAIQRIDRETRVRFRETFDRVNAGLQALFPRVFGGGTAGLVLTGEDLLDAGVALMARPPGKKNSTIHLLSGGEKALTAIALVFSIFQLNPAPFCMLDEVDAPLDDANVARYARLVKEMSGRVQFVYITHNKVAMEMADHLMGVTMHEPGVSRMVAVDVEEAARLAEA
jgi:chromosome segregation protein